MKAWIYDLLICENNLFSQKHQSQMWSRPPYQIMKTYDTSNIKAK